MPHYSSLGNIPHKRHTQFRKPDGGLYSEQLFSTEGFSNDYSILYHIHPPTLIVKCDDPIDVNPKTDDYARCRLFRLVIREFSSSRVSIANVAIKYYLSEEVEEFHE